MSKLRAMEKANRAIFNEYTKSDIVDFVDHRFSNSPVDISKAKQKVKE